ncbi:MAG TPA: hypothetical protein VG935_01235 [Patescibacteria group bacterium]|nr:hypothetical protein [Patescibacteria group bacterium]
MADGTSGIESYPIRPKGDRQKATYDFVQRGGGGGIVDRKKTDQPKTRGHEKADKATAAKLRENRERPLDEELKEGLLDYGGKAAFHTNGSTPVSSQKDNTAETDWKPWAESKTPEESQTPIQPRRPILTNFEDQLENRDRKKKQIF